MRGGCPRGCTFRSEREGMWWDLADAVAGRGGVPPVGYYSKDGEHQAPLLEEGHGLRRGTGTSFGSLALARVGADRDCGPGPSRRRQSHLGDCFRLLRGTSFRCFVGTSFRSSVWGSYVLLGQLARALAVSPVSLPCLKPAAPRFRGGKSVALAWVSLICSKVLPCPLPLPLALPSVLPLSYAPEVSMKLLQLLRMLVMTF